MKLFHQMILFISRLSALILSSITCVIFCKEPILSTYSQPYQLQWILSNTTSLILVMLLSLLLLLSVFQLSKLLKSFHLPRLSQSFQLFLLLQLCQLLPLLLTSLFRYPPPSQSELYKNAQQVSQSTRTELRDTVSLVSLRTDVSFPVRYTPFR